MALLFLGAALPLLVRLVFLGVALPWFVACVVSRLFVVVCARMSRRARIVSSPYVTILICVAGDMPRKLEWMHSRKLMKLDAIHDKLVGGSTRTRSKDPR